MSEMYHDKCESVTRFQFCGMKNCEITGLPVIQSPSDRHQVPETKTKIAIVIEYSQEGDRD